MTEISTLEADAHDIVTNAKAIGGTAANDIATLVAKRVGDVLIAAIVLLSAYLGHVL